jgi:hypothetical protein
MRNNTTTGYYSNYRDEPLKINSQKNPPGGPDFKGRMTGWGTPRMLTLSFRNNSEQMGNPIDFVSEEMVFSALYSGGDTIPIPKSRFGSLGGDIKSRAWDQFHSKKNMVATDSLPPGGGRHGMMESIRQIHIEIQ